MPHTLRSIQIADERLAELTMLCGFDDDLAKQATATSNRIRGLLTQTARPGSASLARAWTTRQCWICCGPGRRPKPSAMPAGAGSEAGSRNLHPGWVNASPARSSTPWTSKR